MIGLVLAAGVGRRLRPASSHLPKALVPVDRDRTVLDIILANFASVGLREAAIVVGYAADAIRARRTALEQRYGIELHLVDNGYAESRNNAYSLWCARGLLTEGVLLANGDTVHPVSVEETLLGQRGEQVLLALDTRKRLGDEEMKVCWSAAGGVRRISKLLDPAAAHGEYIGVALFEPSGVPALVAALAATWRRDPQLYYEDAFQELVDSGHRVGGVSIGEVPWVEIDSGADLAVARGIACLC